MDSGSSTICQGCKADVSEAIAKGASSCPSCGWWLRLSQPSNEQKSLRWPRKRFLFLVFLCFLLGTPVNIALASTYLHFDENMMILILIIGTLGGGFTMAKMVAKKAATFWALGIVFSLCVGALYFGAFVGLVFYAFAHSHGC